MPRLFPIATIVLNLMLTASLPSQLRAQSETAPLGDSFVILLQGLYQPVEHGRNLGLSNVDLSDGSFPTTKIYGVSGLPRRQNHSIGRYYDNITFTDNAYQLPGGAVSATFLDVDAGMSEVDGEMYMIGTAELVISEATGVYKPWVGGSIHMEFMARLILDDDGGLAGIDEHCFCFFSR